METVVHGETGFLCPPDASDASTKDSSSSDESSLAATMANHMLSFLKDTDLAREMGTNGRVRGSIILFSLRRFFSAGGRGGGGGVVVPSSQTIRMPMLAASGTRVEELFILVV